VKRRTRTTSRALDKDAEALRLQLEPIFDEFQRYITALENQVAALQAQAANANLLVLEADGSPSIQTTALIFNQADGFIVTNPGPFQAQIGLSVVGYTDEDARDAIGAALVEGAGIDITVNDGANTITIASTITQYTDEMARDAIGAALVESTGIDITVSDAGDTITIAVDIDEIDPWIVVREIDMGAWPATDFTSGGDGTVALDDGTGSLTWTKTNTANANGGPGVFRRNASDVGDDGGAGVRIQHDASVSTQISNAADTAPRLSIPLNSIIPNFDPTVEYMFQLQVTRLTESGSITAGQPTRLAFGVYAASGNPTGTASRCAGIQFGRSSASHWRPCVFQNATSDTSRSDTEYASGTSDVLTFVISPSSLRVGYTGAYSGGWPATTALALAGFRMTSSSAPGWADVLNHPAMLLFIACCSGVSNTGAIDVMFRRLRILRRVR